MAFFNKRMILLFTNLFLLAGIGTTIANYSTSVIQGEAISTGIVIAEIYGGGGSGSATPTAPFKKDYILLYNSSNSTVNINGWTLQYASSTGNFAINSSSSIIHYTFQNNESIASKKYFLILTGSIGTEGVDINNYDISTSNISIAATGGKLALANDSIAVTFSGTAGQNQTFSNNLVDLVGFSTSANAYEGTSKAPAPSKTTAIRRKAPSIDTDQNGQDFESFTPATPKYSGSDFTTFISDAETFSNTLLSDTNLKAGSCTEAGLNWTNLSSTYSNLSYDAKIEFTNNISNANIISARERYQYLRTITPSLTNFANL